MFHLKPTKHRALSLLLGALSLSSQLSLTDAAMAISLPTSGKKPNFHLPADKLDDSVTKSDTTADSTTSSTEADKRLIYHRLSWAMTKPNQTPPVKKAL